MYTLVGHMQHVGLCRGIQHLGTCSIHRVYRWGFLGGTCTQHEGLSRIYIQYDH